jgi:hypothetical protein
MSAAALEPESLRAILELEEAVAADLRRRPEADGTNLEWLDTAREWSAAVWLMSQRLGAAPLSAVVIERGLARAQRPVFVCGAHRSGTTLVRDLLDGHPALAVLPAEGTFYTHFEKRLAGLPSQEQAAEIGQVWLRRLANPNNQEPFWLLGRSTEQGSPYVEFARELQAWWALLQSRADGAGSLWPLTAVALAWAAMRPNGDIPRMWVEKTPTNERFLARLWREFPAAKVIHVVRDPQAALASHKALLGGFSPSRSTAAIFRNLARSYRIAAEQSRQASPERYLLIQYEDLVADTQQVAQRMAAFLGIELLPTLLEPTVAGMPATRNTSFAAGKGAGVLTSIDRACLRLVLGRNAAKLGYPADRR